MCRCNRTCPNRILQNGLRVKLEVFKTEKKVVCGSYSSFDKFEITLKACYIDFCYLICRDGR